MPCSGNDGPWDMGPHYERESAFFKSFTCAALTLLEANGYAVDDLDFKEAGIDAHRAVNWWKVHKVKDEERRRKEEIRSEAAAKLTAEERRELGL